MRYHHARCLEERAMSLDGTYEDSNIFA
ncbi:MAG: hypothetical protein K0Q62_2159, partial [Phenylobacterium sp.]|nr:hypothetical protein [Phenylobacterium sp.]